MSMRWLGLALAGLAAVAAIAACGDDDEDPEGNVERYCEITSELEVRGDEVFEGLDENSDPEEIEAAERELVESSEDEFEELVDSAPENLREDVQLLLDGIRQRAGFDVDEFSEEDASAAEERVVAFEEAECGE